MKVIVLEDDKVLQEAYEYYFDSYPDFELCGKYCTVFQAIDEYKDINPDIIISDISMPMLNGIEGIKLFRKLDPEVKIVMVSMHDGLKFIRGAFENMASGYLTKPINKISLLDALNTIKYKGVKLSDDVAQTVVSTFYKKKYEIFSKRENEIVELLMQGATYKTIADRIFVTASTVNFHIQNIYLKLNVNSKSEALVKLKEL